MSDRKRNGLILLLVLALVAASGVVVLTMKTYLGLDLQGGVELVYKGAPTPQSKVTPAALQRAVDVMENRVNQLGVAEPSIQTSGSNQIIVQLPNVKNVDEAKKEVGTTARLLFYDWEANVLTPAGKPAADGLLAQDPDALTLSVGSATGPGCNTITCGSTGFYAAVKLASQQPWRPLTKAMQREGDQYFLFGAPGSKACAEAAASAITPTKPLSGVHCLLEGPFAPAVGTSRQEAISQMEENIPSIYVKEGQVLVVPQGTVVMEAVSSHFPPPTYGSPFAGYYAMRDNVAVFGSQVTNPQESTDQGGTPDVSFGFTSLGENQFCKVTGQIAARGQDDHIGTNALDQQTSTTASTPTVSAGVAARRSTAISQSSPPRIWRANCGLARCRSSSI